MNQQPLFTDHPGPITILTPAWLADDLRDELHAKGYLTYSFRFTKAERNVYRKEKPIKTSEWAEKHRVVVTSALPGQWKNYVTPYLVGIMDAADHHSVREIVVCKGPQSGVTECVHNWVGKRIDRDPGPVLYVFPDQLTAKENSEDRIQPMIEKSPRLAAYLTGRQDDASSLRINLQHMSIYLAWASSASRLANKPIRYAIADEIDKEGFRAKTNESSPLKLIDKRLNTYKRSNRSKFFKISTPTVEDGNVWVELTSCGIIFDYWVKCPFCGHWQLMTDERITWEGGRSADTEQILEKSLARYDCSGCDAMWTDHDRDKAAIAGEWRSRGKNIELFRYLKNFNPLKIGFHLPSWVTYFISLSEVAVAFIKSLSDFDAFKDYHNAHKALPWKEVVDPKTESQILEHKQPLPEGVVPEWADALTAGVDMQKNGFWFVVRAWDKDLNSHAVQYGSLSTWDDVKTLVFETNYPVENTGRTMGIWRAAIDTGGGKNDDDDWTRTEEAYQWLRKNSRGRIFGIKGASLRQVNRIKRTVIDKFPNKNKKIPGGLELRLLDTFQYKELLHWRLSREPDESQYLSLHSGTDLDYAKQILAEELRKDKHGVKHFVQIRKDNHLLDCEVYAAACADNEWAPSLSFLARNSDVNAVKAAPVERPGQEHQQEAGRTRPGWFNNR